VNIINKDTKLYGSFSSNPGNNGCIFFNSRFEADGINAIYKSFYSDDIKKSVAAAKTLNFSGFAISMPFKEEILNLVDLIDPAAMEIGAANTVVNNSGSLQAFNTDWMGVYNFFEDAKLKHVNIIGTGGFAKAIVYAFNKLGMAFSIVTRSEISSIDEVSDQYFINATPIEIKSEKNTILDGRPFNGVGWIIANFQAEEQYTIYKKWMQ
jgi:shikimate dehydrogenase